MWTPAKKSTCRICDTVCDKTVAMACPPAFLPVTHCLSLVASSCCAPLYTAVYLLCSCLSVFLPVTACLSLPACIVRCTQLCHCLRSREMCVHTVCRCNLNLRDAPPQLHNNLTTYYVSSSTCLFSVSLSLLFSLSLSWRCATIRGLRTTATTTATCYVGRRLVRFKNPAASLYAAPKAHSISEPSTSF